VFGSGLSVHDDDLVDEQLTTLTSDRDKPVVVDAVRALRAEAHWVSNVYGRSVYVLDRTRIPPAAATAIDVDMVEAQLSQFDYWPSSEVRRHLATCLLAGGCFLANTAGTQQREQQAMSDHAAAMADALVTIDSMKIKKSPGRESGVMMQLMSVVAHIRSTSAWTSPQLDDNGVRVNLHDEIRQIALGCHEVAALRAEIGDRPEGQSGTGSRAAAIHDVSVLSLDAVVDRLAERVSALASYLDRLRALSRELADLDGASRIERVAERIAHLAMATSGDEELSERVSSLVPQAREPDDALPAAVEALREEAESLRGLADHDSDLHQR
jgi:hypothetical protein